jgi:hypothetical protein
LTGLLCRIEPAQKQAAKERQGAAGPSSGRGKKASGGGNLPQPVKGKSRDHVAKVTGKSSKTIAKATAVVEAAEADPARFGELQERMDRTGNVKLASSANPRLRTHPGFVEASRLARWVAIKT